MQTTMKQQASGRMASRKAFNGAVAKPVVRVAAPSRSALVTRAQAVAAPTISKELVDKCVNTIRFLAIDAVNKSKSGHPGMPMGCAPMGYLLWTELMKYNPKNPEWINRDRFVLSAGHGSMFQYAMLHLAGYDSVSVSRAASHAHPRRPIYWQSVRMQRFRGPQGEFARVRAGWS